MPATIQPASPVEAKPAAGKPSTCGPRDLYRSGTSGFTPGSGNLLASGLTTTGYIDQSNLTEGATYYYKVIAVDPAQGGEMSAPSNQASAKCTIQPQPPNPMEALSQSFSRILVKWALTGVSGATYKLFRSTVGNLASLTNAQGQTWSYTYV